MMSAIIANSAMGSGTAATGPCALLDTHQTKIKPTSYLGSCLQAKALFKSIYKGYGTQNHSV